MEMAADSIEHNTILKIDHVDRIINDWADQLTHEDEAGFDPANRFYPERHGVQVLPELRKLAEQLEIKSCPTRNRNKRKQEHSDSKSHTKPKHKK
jgi:hypothetical protein